MKYIFILSLSLSVVCAKAAPWSLEDCLLHAAKNNIQVKISELSTKAAANNTLQSKLALLPSINGSLSNNMSFGNSFNPASFSFTEQNAFSSSASLNLNMPVFAGLTQLNNIKATKATEEASRFDQQNTLNNTALNITNLFLNAITSREIRKVADRQIEITTAQLDRMKKLFAAGSVPELNVLQVEAQLAADEAALTDAKNAEDINILLLRIALQLEDEAFDIAAPEIGNISIEAVTTMSPEAVFSYALLNQPSVKGAQSRVNAALYREKIAKGAFSPTLSLGAALSSSYFSEDADRFFDSVSFEIKTRKVPLSDQLNRYFRKNIGLTLSVPIFNGWQLMTNKANARLQVEQSALQLDATKWQLKQDIYQAHANARSAANAWLSRNKSYEAALKAFEASEKRFATGLLNNLEFQQAKAGMLNAQSEQLRARYNYVFRLKVLDFYQGKPITFQP